MKSIEELKEILFETSTKLFPEEDVENIRKACLLSEKYSNNFHFEGEPIKVNPFQHSLKTAIILEKELNLDADAILSALLMYCDENDEIKLFISPSIFNVIKRIRKIFGIEVYNLEINAEYFRKLLVNMSEDLRVLMICLIDRLVSMREIVNFPVQLQDKFCMEAFDLFAPLAHRIGLYNIYTELCNRSFRHFHKQQYDEINIIRENLIKSKQEKIDSFINAIDKLLKDNGYNFTIKYRVKSPFSIWNKIENKKVTFNEIYDIFALRVIFELPRGIIDDEIAQVDREIEQEERANDELFEELEHSDLVTGLTEDKKRELEIKRKNVIRIVKNSKRKIKKLNEAKQHKEELKANEERGTCWKIYALVTNQYKPVVSRTRDWVSKPRDNGYESLHTTLTLDEDTFVELQIRSKRMDHVAEYGLAAHWQYKEKSATSSLEKWLAKVRGALENDTTALGYVLEDFKPDTEIDEILVFTPDKEIKRLPAGSTVLDFAYEIHSQIGNKCVGGIVNGKLVKEYVNGKCVRRIEGGTNVDKTYKLQNGDTVSIRTSKNQRPSLDWLKMVTTTKAKYNIRKSLDEDYRQKVDEGKEILKRKLKNWKYDFTDHYNDLINHFGYKFGTEMFYDIAVEKLNTLKIKNYLDNKGVFDADINIKDDTEKTAGNKKTNSRLELVTAEDNKRIRVQPTKCCDAIMPGEKVFGFFSSTGEIKIHRFNCPNALNLQQRFPYRIVKLKWKELPLN